MKRRPGQRFCEWCGEWKPIRQGKAKQFDMQGMCRACHAECKKQTKRYREEWLRGREAK